MQEQSPENCMKQTLGSLVDGIDFTKPKKKKTTLSETDSISSNHTVESELKEKSKIWAEHEVEQLQMLLNKFGTDFHILSTFFPKKTKNQIKNKYKQLANMKKKEERAEGQRLMAVASLFKEEEMEQEN